MPSDQTVVIVDPSDPLVPAFAVQHDLRLRFLNALDEIAVILVEEDNNDFNAICRIESVVKEALSEDAISEWFEAGRPLDYVEPQLEHDAQQMAQAALQMMQSLRRRKS